MSRRRTVRAFVRRGLQSRGSDSFHNRAAEQSARSLGRLEIQEVGVELDRKLANLFEVLGIRGGNCPIRRPADAVIEGGK